MKKSWVQDSYGSSLAFFLILFTINSYYIYNLNDQVSRLKEAIKDLPKIEAPSAQNNVERSSFTVAEIDMPIVAVSNDEEGMVNKMAIKLIPGSNDILINTNPFLEPDVQYAVKTAVKYAISRIPNYQNDKDFIFDFDATKAQLIGGESAGAAATILAIADLENKGIKKDAVITGTINPDGSLQVRLEASWKKRKRCQMQDTNIFLYLKASPI